MSRSALAIVAAVAASATLLATYLALGGASYRTTAVADPCGPRVWSSPHGVEAALQQVALSTADGVGCSLGASREDVVLALASRADLSHFAASHHLSDEQVETAVRAGLRRAVDDAQHGNAIGGTVASGLRFAADHLPIGIVLDALRGVAGLLGT